MKREAGIPDADNTSDRWSVDHLLLDQYGVPTLVEVKRSSDTIIRRELVGQLLEYAANAERYWPAGKIRQLAVEQHEGEEKLNEKLAKLRGMPDTATDADSIEPFWNAVEENIQQGRIRLLFVADELPREMKRIIEFLNAKMKEVEVLGIELRYYTTGELTALVPRVIGQTEATRDAKGSTRKSQPVLTREQLLSECPAEIRSVVEEILARGESAGLEPYWGVRGFSLRARDDGGELHSMCYCYPCGVKDIDIAFVDGYLPAGLRDTELGTRLAAEFLKIEGVHRRGNWTYRLEFSRETVERVYALLAAVVVVAGELRKTDN